jgi:tRNA pseudouridine38-40 synthase
MGKQTGPPRAGTRYRATVAYVGSAFHGWQVQHNAPRTVQAVLQDALARFAREAVKVEGAGRTDTGVHAEGQVVHFDLARPRELHKIRDAWNMELPADVRVLEVAEASPDFHARFDARWKEYLYRWSRAAVVSPREAEFVAPISPRADASRMREAARSLPGTRDFSIFAVRVARSEPAVRTLEAVTISEHGDEIRALFRGDGFLRGMVRSIAGVLAESARGRIPDGRRRIEELFATGDRRRLSPKALARGLTLVRVGYGVKSPK